MNQQSKGLLWLIVVVLLAVVAAVGLPRLAAGVPWTIENGLGRLGGHSDLPGCGERNPAAAASLAKVVARLYPLAPDDSRFPLSVRVVPGSEVNAFAALGGRVSIYDGLVREAESPEELAGVLAHEIEHVKRRHIIQGVVSRLLTLGALRHVFGGGSDLARAAIDLSFGRAQERQADQGGLERLRRARVSVNGYERFFLRREGDSALLALLSDHPSNSDRAELIASYKGGPADAVLTAAEWKNLRAICR